MKLVYKPKSGHKYFEDEQKRLHIADDSGDTPLETEDGDLIIDSTRPITVTSDSVWGGFTIPLLTADEKQTATIGGIHEVLFLQRRGLKLDINARRLVEQYLDDLSLDFS